jgi:hypothetical protein
MIRWFLIFFLILVLNNALASGLTITCDNKNLIASAEVTSYDIQSVVAQKVTADILVSEKKTKKLILFL